MGKDKTTIEPGLSGKEKVYNGADIVTDPDFQIPNIKELELLGNTFLIRSVKFGEAMLGQYAIVYCVEEKGIFSFRTHSFVLIGQLRLIKEVLDAEDCLVEVTLRSEKGEEGDYYTFGRDKP